MKKLLWPKNWLLWLVNLSTQKGLDADSKAIQHIEFVRWLKSVHDEYR